jgi:hypothetical protein
MDTDTNRLRIISLRSDCFGIVRICQVLLEPGFRGENTYVRERKRFLSRQSTQRTVFVDNKEIIVTVE